MARAAGVEVCLCNLDKQEMSTIPVELPDHLQSYVDESAVQAGFANASEYIVALVAAASEKQGEIEQALIAGIKSGAAEPWTDEEWQAIRSRVVSKALSK
jgi:Arc/MetJ-type ribon-helix-helix transcriptional regulator